MFLKFKNLLRTDLIKVSFLNSIATVIKMITGLISVKVVASLIGPSGVALLGQLNNFSAIVLSISNGGINAGITKYVAENSDSEEKYIKYLGTGFRITVFLSALASLFLIIGAAPISDKILHDKKYKEIFIVFGITLILYSLNTLLISVINGFREFRKYIIINISGSIVGLLFSIFLAVQYGIYGALLASVTFQSIVFFVTLSLISKSSWFNWKKISKSFNNASAIQLAHYSLMALTSALTVPGGQLIVRGYITKYQGIENAGLWEGMNRISSMYLMVITTSLGVYFLPKLAQLKNSQEFRREIFKVYKLIVPFLFLTSATMYIFRHLIIQLIFTKEFSGIQELFAFQLVGDILKIMGWVLGYLLLAKAMSKTYILMEIVNFLLLISFSFYLVQHFGTIGATIGYTMVYFIYLVILCFVFRKILFQKTL